MTNYLYTYGDIVYFLSAVFYVLGAMRDCGWFFWMPLAGRQNYEAVTATYENANGAGGFDGEVGGAAPGSASSYGSAPMKSAVGFNGKAAVPTRDVGSPLLTRA